MFGGVTEIAENFSKALNDKGKGDLSGIGLMMEGLDYNPVTYEFVTGMIWEKEVPDLNEWKRNYLKSRYGHLNDSTISAWNHIFDYYYTKSGLFEVNPIIKRPFPVKDDIRSSTDAVEGLRLLIMASDDLGNIDAYRFDIVNLFRQVFGQYAGHLLHEVTISYQEKNISRFEASVTEFTTLAQKLEKLMATREEFLFGKWIADSKKHATDQQEAELYEWNAKAIITTWGGRALYGYAIKDWSGLYSSYYIPKWEKLFDAMRSEITGGKKLDYEQFVKDIMVWEDNWVSLHEKDLVSVPTGNSVAMAKELWAEYGAELINHK
jgi:alpha-N-acetylglucosaminidase